MRILLVNRWYPIGGVGNYVRILSTALADLGHSVTVLTASLADGTSKTAHDWRINVHSIHYPATPYRLRRLPILRNYFRALELRRYAKRVELARRALA